MPPGRLQEEGTEIIRKCFTDDRFDFDGHYYHLQGVSFAPKPLQKPHPPIYHGGVSHPILLRAARLGVQGLCGRASRRDWDEFWAEMTSHGHDPDAIRNVPLRFMYVADSDEQALAQGLPQADGWRPATPAGSRQAAAQPTPGRSRRR
ncbi:MAG TPA: LLM class flavin-dependent oxidoreductase [Dehalococcoidia bacterium]|nr:LLM class flavin-dependent oxidoreductase [Dehalococcoidia bacterium]